MKSKNPISRFYQEHQQVIQRLQALAHSVDEFRRKGYSGQRAARFTKVLEAIDYELRFHNTVEESALLKVLDDLLPPQGPTYVVRQEYEELQQVTRRLQNLFQELQADTKNRQKLVELELTAEWLIKLLQEHISKENDVLFPLAQRVLTPPRRDEVARRFKTLMAAS
jgi:hemerythrin-like domain-containing protein